MKSGYSTRTSVILWEWTSLGFEGIVLDFDNRQATINSCQGVVFPIGIHAKSHHVEVRPVYTASQVVVQPKTTYYVPIRVKSKLPSDREFLFDPEPSDCCLAAYLVDANFTCVPVTNTTNVRQPIARHKKLGCIREADFAMTC
jgi:hypothetical protein